MSPKGERERGRVNESQTEVSINERGRRHPGNQRGFVWKAKKKKKCSLPLLHSTSLLSCTSCRRPPPKKTDFLEDAWIRNQHWLTGCKDSPCCSAVESPAERSQPLIHIQASLIRWWWWGGGHTLYAPVWSSLHQNGHLFFRDPPESHLITPDRVLRGC